MSAFGSLTRIRELPLHRLVTTAGWSAGAAIAVAVALGVGHFMPSRPAFAWLVVIIVLAFGVTLADAAVMPLLALVPLFAALRLPLGSADVSVSDLALALAFVPAVAFGTKPYSAPMRRLLWLAALYQVATLFTVIANPYARNTIEWFHAWLLTAGALVVGWTIGREGHVRAGLSLLMLTSVGLAAVAVTQAVPSWLAGSFQPVYPDWPFPMHKNFVGCVLGMAAVIGYARPRWLGWSDFWALAGFWACALGIVATQSRQAVVALAVALFVLALRGDPHRRRSKLIVVVTVSALVLVATLVRDQLASGNEFNSAFQRLTWFQDSLAIWQRQPVVGVGLRWWYTDRFPHAFQPPNAEMEVLSSAGVIGVLAFLVMMVGALVALWRLDRVYGTLAFTVLLSRFVQGQLDLFWVAAQTSLPFVVVGLCLGKQAYDEAHRPDARLEEARSPVELGR